MDSSFDTLNYLQRRADELVSELRSNGADTRTAVASLTGTVRALEATKHLDRAAGLEILADFEQSLEDHGFTERVSIGFDVEGTVAAELDGESSRPPRPQAPVPEVEDVLAVNRALDVSGSTQLILLSVVRWSTAVDLNWTWITPEGSEGEPAQSDRPQPPSGSPWRFDAWDDIGTRYTPKGAGLHGGSAVTWSTATFAPRLPDEATQLTVVVREPDSTTEVARTIVDLS